MNAKHFLFALVAVAAVGFGVASAQTATNNATNTVTLPAPSGGGTTWNNNTSQTIQWNAPANSTSTVNLALIPYTSCNLSATASTTSCTYSNRYVIGGSVPNYGTYSTNIFTDTGGRVIPGGQYLLNVSDNSNNNLYKATGSSAQIITIPNYNWASNTPTGFSLSISSGTPGTIVTVMGSGFSTSTTPVIQFGNYDYVAGSGVNVSGTSLQFTVPGTTYPCSSLATPYGSNATSSSACTLAPAMLVPGTYLVKIPANGTSYNFPFTLNAASTAPTPTPSNLAVPPALPFPEGSVVKVSGVPTVYLVTGGMFEPFNSAQVFLASGYQWSQIQTIDQSQFNTQYLSLNPVPWPNNSLVKTSDDPTVYLIVGGQKSAIPSMDVFDRLGLSLGNIHVISMQDLQSYPSAPNQQ